MTVKHTVVSREREESKFGFVYLLFVKARERNSDVLHVNPAQESVGNLYALSGKH